MRILNALMDGFSQLKIVVKNKITEDLTFEIPTKLNEGDPYVLRKYGNTAKFTPDIRDSISLSSPNGAIWQVEVDNSGNLSATFPVGVADFIARVNADDGTVYSQKAIFQGYLRLGENILLLLPAAAGKANKIYSIAPEDGSGDADVMRNSTAFAITKEGLLKEFAENQPRIIDGESPHILVEGESINLLENQDVDSSYWQRRADVTKTVGVDGTESAFVSAGRVNVSSPIELPEGRYYLSAFVKSMGATSHTFRTQNGISGFRFADKHFTIETGEFSNGSYLELNDGWFEVKTILDWPGGDLELTISQPGNGDLAFGSFKLATDDSSYHPNTRQADVIEIPVPVGASEIHTTIDGETSVINAELPETYRLPEGKVESVEIR